MKEKCADCKKRCWKVRFCKSTMDLVHGFEKKICRQCFIKIIEEEKKGVDSNLIKQRKLLMAESQKEDLK